MASKARLTPAIFGWGNFIQVSFPFSFGGIYRRAIWQVFLLSGVLTSCHDKDHLPSAQDLISFELKNIAGVVSIDQSGNIITVNVPYRTLLQNVTPIIEVSKGATIVPASGIPQDFTKPVYYTVKGNDGERKVYKVTCRYLAQTLPEIITASADTVRAGDTLLVTGQNFGNFALAIAAYVKEKNAGSETPVPFRLVDSLHIQLFLPPSLPTSDYHLVIGKDNLRTTSKKSINIRIHRPEITAIRRTHIRQSDTLWVAGNFIKPGTYTYNLRLNNKISRQLSPAVSSDGKLGAVPGNTVPPGVYEILVLNSSERSISTSFSQPVRIYDDTLPFVNGVMEPKASYAEGETVRLATYNFSTFAARFYSIQLIGTSTQHTQNAIFNPQNNSLDLTIPTGIANGAYRISIDLLDNAGQPIYEIGMDDLILVQ
jgi:hypothetical protein